MKQVLRATVADFAHELAHIELGARYVAGVDEVGRGALAGPVAAAAVILNAQNIPDGLADSKQLSASRRESLFEMILRDAHCVSIAFVPACDIDVINIRQASLRSMSRAVRGLVIVPGHVLIDGRDIPQDLPCAASALIGGDGRCCSIAAASIIAKVVRDRLMRRAAVDFPHYGFERHVGYATPLHRKAISQHGPCVLHRLSFAPLRRPAVLAV